MSIEDLYVEVAKQKAMLAKIYVRLDAIENTVYERSQTQNTVTTNLSATEILKDLDVSLSDRLEIVNENEVRAREYFHNKDDWSTINKLLKAHGFSWVSAGKQSCWRRQ